jgi:hypothetical protein
MTAVQKIKADKSTPPVKAKEDTPLWRIGFDQLQKNLVGRPRKYETPQALAKACAEYFSWLELNPLKSAKAIAYKGDATLAEEPKLQAATLHGLCLYIGISRVTWHQWRESRPDFSNVMQAVEDAIYHQKFTGAAADLLNARIISRDLGLVERKDVTSADEPLPQAEMSDREIAMRVAFMLAKGVEAIESDAKTIDGTMSEEDDT